MELIQKLLPQFDKRENGCWIWTGAVRGPQNPYGCVKVGGRRGSVLYVHRLLFEHFKGTIPSGKLVLHTCNIPRCCNPDHLYIGSHEENSRQMVKDGRNSCGDRKAARTKTALLTEQQVREIKAALLKRVWGQQTKLAGEYGVTVSTINLIAKGKIWKDVLPLLRTDTVLT